MRAWQLETQGSPADVLIQGERAVPEPGPGEVQIRVAAAGVGLPDVMMCRGTYVFEPPRPAVLGQEIVGVVTVLGEGCALEVGQRVMGVTSFYTGNGGFAEFCIAPEFSLYPVPEAMSDAEAAAFTIPYHTAWVGLKVRGKIAADEVLVVHGGAGGTGTAAIRLAKALGATVIATAGGEEKLAYCKDAGADECIDNRKLDVSTRVMEITGGRGADVVFDPVGGELFEQSVAYTASGGRLLAVGFASGRWGAPDSGELVMRNCAALGVFVGAHDHDEMLQCHQSLSELYAAERLTAKPDVITSFDEIGGTVAALERREILGKAVAVLR
jgi:NADPH2:quinone reductase